MLAVEGVEPIATPVHHLLDDGSFAITVPVDGVLAGMAVAAGTAGVQAVLEMTDYAPLPLREPVRSLVWIRGRLHAVPDGEVAGTARPDRRRRPQSRSAASELRPCRRRRHPLHAVRLEIESVVVADSTGAESVGVGALLAAQPGPVLRDGVVLAAAPRVRAPRRRRPAGRPAADAAAPRPRPAAGPRPLRRAAARGGRRRRPRRAAAVRQARSTT